MNLQRLRPLAIRIFWFGFGGALSVFLNAGPFHLLRTRAGLSGHWAYAISLCFATGLFLFWNYYINFRTSASFRSCAARYLVAVGLCTTINYLTVISGLKLRPGWWLAIIGTVQVGMGGVKFLLYHFWVYPAAHIAEKPESAATAL